MNMRKTVNFIILIAAAALLLSRCSTPLTLTTWKNPDVKAQVSKVAVMPLFEKLEYLKPFEQAVVGRFNSHGLKAIGSLDFLNPAKKYEINDIKKKCDSLGVDAMLLFIYEGVDKSENYVAPTTYYNGYYGGYGGYWAGGYWGGGYYGATVTTGGYWETSAVFNLTAKLYVKGSKDPLWTGAVRITDPWHIDEAGYMVGGTIYADWKKENLIKATGGK
jgi:hypothetical protein